MSAQHSHNNQLRHQEIGGWQSIALTSVQRSCLALWRDQALQLCLFRTGRQADRCDTSMQTSFCVAVLVVSPCLWGSLWAMVAAGQAHGGLHASHILNLAAVQSSSRQLTCSRDWKQKRYKAAACAMPLLAQQWQWTALLSQSTDVHDFCASQASSCPVLMQMVCRQCRRDRTPWCRLAEPWSTEAS